MITYICRNKTVSSHFLILFSFTLWHVARQISLVISISFMRKLRLSKIIQQLVKLGSVNGGAVGKGNADSLSKEGDDDKNDVRTASVLHGDGQ